MLHFIQSCLLDSLILTTYMIIARCQVKAFDLAPLGIMIYARWHLTEFAEQEA